MYSIYNGSIRFFRANQKTCLFRFFSYNIFKLFISIYRYLQSATNIYITFNPFIENVKLMPYDKELIFGSAILLLFNTIGMSGITKLTGLQKQVRFNLSS